MMMIIVVDIKVNMTRLALVQQLIVLSRILSKVLTVT